MNDKLLDNKVYKMLSDPKKRLDIFLNIELNKRGFVLLKLAKKTQLDILNSLTIPQIIKILNYLDPDETTDLIQTLPEHKQKSILKKLGKRIQEKVEFLLKFNARTAAGIMSLDYVEVNKNITFKQLSRIIKKHEIRTGKVPAILVVQEGFLLGEIQAHQLAISDGGEKITKYVKKLPAVQYNASKDEVIKSFNNNPHSKIVVLDEDFGILGVIYSDDVIRIIHKHTAKHLGDFAGVSDEEDVLDSAVMKVEHRYKWLILNLITVMFVALVVGFFEDTISKLTLLAIYMPVVAGMGGNAGIQTLAVTVRGIALNELDWKIGKRVILKEVIAGAINGLITGALVALIAVLWNKSALLGLILGLSMIINLIIAGFFGSIIPLIMKSLGKDPATSATIFITTATDVFGFVVFLGLASILL